MSYSVLRNLPHKMFAFNNVFKYFICFCLVNSQLLSLVYLSLFFYMVRLHFLFKHLKKYSYHHCFFPNHNFFYVKKNHLTCVQVSAMNLKNLTTVPLHIFCFNPAINIFSELVKMHPAIFLPQGSPKFNSIIS